MWVDTNVSRRALVGEAGSCARRAVSLLRVYTAAASLRSPVSNASTAVESSLYDPRGSVRIRSRTGRGSALYTSLRRNPVVSSASRTLDANPVAHFTCDQTCAPPGPSTFLPSSSGFNTQSFNAWIRSVFDVFGAAVNGHCFLNASTRCSYVSFSAASRLVNHSSAPLPYVMLFFRQLILSLSVL